MGDRRHVYGWRKKLGDGWLILPKGMAALPMFAELLVVGAASKVLAGTAVTTGVEIILSDVVICVGADTDEDLLSRTIRAA